MWKHEKNERSKMRKMTEEQRKDYLEAQQKTLTGAFLGGKKHHTQSEQVSFQQHMMGLLAEAPPASTPAPDNQPVQAKIEEIKVEEDIPPHRQTRPVIKMPQSEQKVVK